MYQVYKLMLFSRQEELKKVVTFVESVSTKSLLSENDKYDTLLVLSEAVTNAIVHGNKSEETKKVLAVCEVNTEEIRMTIQDEGSGFNPDNVPNPLDKKNLLKTSGRGVFLIKKIAKSAAYSFSKKGTTLNIVLQRRP